MSPKTTPSAPSINAERSGWAAAACVETAATEVGPSLGDAGASWSPGAEIVGIMRSQLL